MKPSKLSERQRKMILDRKVTDPVLAERLGMSVRQIKRQRARMLEDSNPVRQVQALLEGAGFQVDGSFEVAANQLDQP